MFEEEKEEWKRLFNYFQEKFNEEVGILFGSYENEEIGVELDLFVGEESELVRGIRVFQEVPSDEEDLEDEDEEEDLELEDEEDEEEDTEVFVYDLVALPGATVTGEEFVEFVVERPEVMKEEGDPEKSQDRWISVKLYTVDEDPLPRVSTAVITPIHPPGDPTILAEDPELMED